MTENPRFSDMTTDDAGLVPCIIQDATTRQVLMVGYQDEDAWERTADTGLVHFHSRSRATLWMKGESSGDTLTVVSIRSDCDQDAVLIEAVPAGPTCHTGSVSCFSPASAPSLGQVIDELTRTIKDRAEADPDASYTARLMANGDLAARKVLEEAGELAFAAKDTALDGPDLRVVEEAADLIYHLLALLAQQNVATQRVAAQLVSRRGYKHPCLP